MDADSLDRWIVRLNRGDERAVGPIFRAFEPYLRVVVRRQITARLRPKVDSADVVQSVFADVVRGVRAGGWHFAGRTPLLAFLRLLARRQLANRYDRFAPAIDREVPLDRAHPLALPADARPRPSQEVRGVELRDAILRACPPAHREVALLRMQGHKLREIADRTGLHPSSVRRILYDLARRLGAEGIEPAGGA